MSSSISRVALACALCAVVAACGERPLYDADFARAERLEILLSVLAADSMEGRRTGTEGAHRAARFS